MQDGKVLFSLWLNETADGKKYQSGPLIRTELVDLLGEFPDAEKFRVSIFARKKRDKDTDANYTGVISVQQSRERPRQDEDMEDKDGLPF